jgi:hypothetical protein
LDRERAVEVRGVMAVTVNLTPLRRRILASLDQQGPMDIQEIGYEFSSNPRGLKHTFKHPAAATRFGGMLMAPLREAGLVWASSERFAYRYKLMISDAGRALLRTAGQEDRE